MKVNISKQVEAGVRLQSRSPASYWTNFGFANNEASAIPNNIHPQQSKYVKLRGAYVLLTPGYAWLDQALIGSSDWGMFDPFTIGQVRYIDRDNYNGLYFKGKLPLAAAAGNSAACRCRTTCSRTTARGRLAATATRASTTKRSTSPRPRPSSARPGSARATSGSTTASSRPDNDPERRPRHRDLRQEQGLHAQRPKARSWTAST